MIQPQLRPEDRRIARVRHEGPRGRADGRPDPTDLPARAEPSLLPATARLLTRLRRSDAGAGLLIGEACPEQVARYCVRPQNDGPFVRFLVEEANSSLLGLVQRGQPGFDVLQARRGRFKYHWHNDLVRAFDEEVPILSRYWAFSGKRAIAVEHLSVPVLVRHRVRGLAGWFTFGEDPADALRAGSSLSIVRRPLRSRIVQLPGLTTPGEVPDAAPARGPGRWRRTRRAKRPPR